MSGGGYRPDGGEYGTGGQEYTAGQEYGPYQGRDSGPAQGTGGQETGGYPTGSAPTDAYPTGRYSTGGYQTGGGESGGYGSGSGSYQRDSGRYPAQSGQSGQSGQYRPESGAYRSESGPYQRETGPYEAGSGGYRSDTGGYRAGGGGRTDTGGYRTGSGAYRTGSHRVARERRGGRRWAAVLAGVGAGVGVCVLAVFVILSGVGAGDGKDGGQVVGSGAAESSPTAKGERALVPDSCTIVGQDVIDRLAPGSERTQADSYQNNERQNQCVWGAYAGDTKRQLTLELRAIEGSADQTPTDAARSTFTSERGADESGRALLPGQKLTDKIRLDGVGDDGYIVYSVDGGQGAGEAVANVRVANVLITIHYSGSDDGDPLSSRSATDGATEVAKAVIQALDQG
ncbi:hypothetical protein [Actinomadura sp. GTD37]|uniref:hypothetical protein n=1 Tax=Actinomadura sp. GTD37 TaxID=1778030 RepID=UPI0035BED63E